jgi:tetratricopeptide (TPR) repeat protein
MMFIGYCMLVFAVSVLALYRWRLYSLHGDDGNFFYEAEYNKPLNIYATDYWGVNFIAKVFRKIYPVKSPQAYYDLKTIWFSLLNTALFILCQLLFGNLLISFTAVFFHLIFQMLPQTGYPFTHGENFLLLPLLVGFIVFYYAYTLDLFYLYFIAGLLFGHSYVVKIVSMIIMAPLLVISLFYVGMGDVLLMLLGFLVVLFLQVFVAKGRRLKVFLIGHLLRHYLFYYLHYFHIFKIKKVKEIYAGEKIESHYVNQTREASENRLFHEFKETIVPSIRESLFICLIALVAMIYNLFSIDFETLLVTLVFLSCFSIPFIEKFVCPGHFNQTWLPISVLGAIGVWLILSSDSLFLYILSAVIILPNMFILSMLLYKQLKDPFSVTVKPIHHKFVFRYAEQIGKEIKEQTSEKDYMIEWGNVPSVYIYSQRRPWLYKYIFFYIRSKLLARIELNYLYKQIKYFPPRIFLFFLLGQKERFSMESISEITKLPYNHAKTFKIYELEKKYHENMYMLDVIKFREMLFERFMSGFYSKEKTRTYGFLDKDYKSVLQDRLGSFFEREDIELLMDFERTYSVTEMAIYINIFKYIKEGAVAEAEGILKDIQETAYYGLYYMAMGEVAFMNQDTEKAKMYFIKSLQSNNYLGTAWNDIGVIAYQQKEYEEARKCFGYALEMLPGYEDAVQNMKLVRSEE